MQAEKRKNLANIPDLLLTQDMVIYTVLPAMVGSNGYADGKSLCVMVMVMVIVMAEVMERSPPLGSQQLVACCRLVYWLAHILYPDHLFGP
jgi:hypothetical protein